MTEYGQFLGFDTLTLVPFDVDAIDVNIMSDYEIRLLRQYHKLVYKKISPYLNIEEQGMVIRSMYGNLNIFLYNNE